jgi:hypothetical protein
LDGPVLNGSQGRGIAASFDRRDVITVNEAPAIESTDVYEPPLLAEAGDYAELTQGVEGVTPEGWHAHWMGF